MSGVAVKSPSLQSSLCYLLQVGTSGDLYLKYHYIKPMSITECHVIYAYEEVCCLDVKLLFFFKWNDFKVTVNVGTVLVHLLPYSLKKKYC